jgi:hypothetical protein
MSSPLLYTSSKQAALSRSTKPLRSILKPTQGQTPLSPEDLNTALNCFSPQEPGSFRKMLNSALQHLGRPSRSARLDAYLALNGALKTYDGIPDPEAILGKSSLLVQFMARDLAWKDDEGRVDRDIVTQALHLASAIIFNARTAHALDEEFRSFLLERSLVVLDQPEMPKAVIKGHMLLLCQHRLHVAVLTPARAEKLISALYTIQDRCSGNSFIPARLIIYHRILEQAPGTMLGKMREWVEHVFHGLLSNHKETRTRALETLTAAGLSLGTNFQAAKGIYELFERKSSEEEKYGEFLLRKLWDNVEDPGMAPYVPQIWTAVILFLRSKRRPFERWPSIKHWLRLLQRCLNSGDNAIRHQAHIAWNRLVFSVMPDSSTSDSFRAMLKVPIEVGLKIRVKDKHSQVQRALAMESFCNLVHYAMRPGLSHDEIDAAWNMYIDGVLGPVASFSSRGSQFTCNVLQGLFSRSESVWNINAANEPRAIKPEDLARLEPRWIRSRFSLIVGLLEPVLAMHLSPQATDRSHVDRCWQSCLTAIAEAGTQEVKTSNELKEVIAQLTNLFRRLWSTSAELLSADEISTWFARFQSLVEAAIDTLGQGHFVQDFLTMTGSDEVAATVTPSSRASKHPLPTRSPAVLLMALHCRATKAVCQTESYARSPVWLLRLLVGTKSALSTNLLILQRSLHVCLDPTSMNQNPDSNEIIWTSIAQSAVVLIDSQNELTSNREGPINTILKSALFILQHGIHLTSGSRTSQHLMTTLYATLCTFALHRGGDGSLVLGIMEPFAKIIADNSATVTVETVIQLTTVVLKHSRWPKNRQALDLGRKYVGGYSLDSPKTTAFDPFDCVYTMVCTASKKAYCTSLKAECLQLFFESFIQFLRGCPPAILGAALRRTQETITNWVEDQNQELFRGSVLPEHEANTSTSVVQCWTSVLDLVRSLPRKEPSPLKSLEPLFIAGFSSPCKDVVNATITFWNTTFGIETALRYPPTLEAVLFARSLQADLLLPGLRKDTENIASFELPEMIDLSQTNITTADIVPNLGMTSRLATMLRRPETENTLIRQHLAQTALARQASPAKVALPKQPISLPKLRHDDSQIEFAAIEPSSPISEGTSQLLTDRQLEIRERQRDDAHMYPQMSSSPPPTGDPTIKRLVFAPPSVSVSTSGVLETPGEFNDANPMSDDLPSSPTPKAVKQIAGPVVLQEDAEEDYGDDDDSDLDSAPPSSPPRISEEGHQNKLHEKFPDDNPLTTDAVAMPNKVSLTEDGGMGTEQSDVTTESDIETALNLQSDSALPTAQLLREEAAAVNGEASPEQQTVVDRSAAEIRSQMSQKYVAGDNGQTEDVESSRASSPLEVDDMTQLSAVSASQAEEPAEQRANGKKRKRASGTIYTSRKRKPSSPLKKLITNMLGMQQQDEDGDIGEEIVVASNQSPGVSFMDDESDAVEETGQSQEDQAGNQAVDIAVAETLAVQGKRSRGRPRKQDKGMNIGREPAVKSLKRRASNMSADLASDDGVQDGNSEIMKLRGGRSVGRIRTSQPSQESPRSIRATRRSSLAAHARVQEDNHEQPVEATNPDEPSTSQEQPRDPVNERKIAQPKSLLGRLREILAECRNMILGSQEEREFDNVLFEMRREIHNAGRRSRNESST